MNTPKAGSWIAGTAFVAVLILAAAWFLAISPVLATASETRSQAVAQQDQNAIARVKIAKLKEQFSQLGELTAQLAAMQLQIPTSYDLAGYQRQLAAIALTHEVTVASLNVAPATTVVPVVTAEAAATAAAAAAAATSDSASATSEVAEAAAPVAAGLSGLSSLALNIEVVGTYSHILAFLQDLQAGTDRLFLVETLTGTSLEQEDASGGRPATSPGDLSLVIAGSLYVLQDPTVAAVPADPDAVAPVLPVPDGAKNPLIPLS